MALDNEECGGDRPEAAWKVEMELPVLLLKDVGRDRNLREETAQGEVEERRGKATHEVALLSSHLLVLGDELQQRKD
jgi:hypothetical protein